MPVRFLSVSVRSFQFGVVGINGNYQLKMSRRTSVIYAVPLRACCDEWDIEFFSGTRRIEAHHEHIWTRVFLFILSFILSPPLILYQWTRGGVGGVVQRWPLNFEPKILYFCFETQLFYFYFILLSALNDRIGPYLCSLCEFDIVYSLWSNWFNLFWMSIWKYL